MQEVGSEVTRVKVGDSVLLSFASCDQCHNCKYGAPGYCAQFTQINFSGNSEAFEAPDKDQNYIGGSFFGQSSFSNLTRVQESSVVNATTLVESEDDLKLFSPLGCGLQVQKALYCKPQRSEDPILTIHVRQVQGQ